MGIKSSARKAGRQTAKSRPETANPKTARKTAKPAKIPQPNGKGELYSGGVPGNKGGTGRPPNEFVERMRELASSEERLKHVETILDDPNHAQYMAARRYVTEYGYGKPNQPVEHGVSSSLADLIAQIPR